MKESNSGMFFGGLLLHAIIQDRNDSERRLQNKQLLELDQYFESIPNNDKKITDKIMVYDYEFDKDEFIINAQINYKTYFSAWSDADFSRLSKHFTEGVLDIRKSQIQAIINMKQRRYSKLDSVEKAFMHVYYRDTQHEMVTLCLKAKLIEYITSKHGRLLSGSREARRTIINLLTLTRKINGSEWKISNIIWPDQNTVFDKRATVINV